MQLRELSFAERRDWLRLTRTHTVGPVAFRDLLKRFGTAAKALDALPDLIRKKDIKPPSLKQVEAEMEANEELGIRLLAACEPDYPAPLRAIDPPPPIISVWGQSDLLSKPCVAIIGSRNASANGQRFAGQIAGELAENGFVIVSGLARGIDGCAHRSALVSGTIGVLGGGVDHIYPRQNEDLHLEMRERGLLVSESPLGYRATARDFPRRNRIISGLCRGVVVIEAAERSGTLITARYAAEQGREVMAAPGSPLDPRTKGCNRLIRQGAALIESAEDILECLAALPETQFLEPEAPYNDPPVLWRVAAKEIESAKTQLLEVLSPTPSPRDDIIRASGLPTPIVNAALLELELNAEIVVEADGRISILY
ncbi:DNA-processing protein DprA [Litorimonas haliclonae]|uniref:DNA-processing protein DprA n=1 Tax=Litorimonas haliclonae TaxID=2081977 RepID=UPI0039F0C9E0